MTNTMTSSPINTTTFELTDHEIEREFAERSARYLQDHGLRPIEIQNALVSELDVKPVLAESIVAKIAA